MSNGYRYRRYLALLLTLLSMFLLVVSLVYAEEDSNDYQVQSSEAQLHEEIELRRSIGFRSDVEHIQAVHEMEDVVSSERLGGVAFTPAEANELSVRIDLEKDGEVLQTFFAREPGLQGVFGGIYLDHAAGSEDHTVGGKLILQLVKDHEKVDDVPSMWPSLHYPERLQIKLVDFSNRHLEQQFQAISNATSQHPEIKAISLNRENNQIEVLLTPSDGWLVSEGDVDKSSLPPDLAVLLSDSSIVVREGEVEKTPTTIVDGGDRWGSAPGISNCTLGFEVWHSVSGAYSMVTAGHCIAAHLSTGQSVYHYSTQIGTNPGFWKDGDTLSTGRGIDAGIIHMNNQGTASDDIKEYNYLVDVHGSTSSYVTGYWRCWTGMSSGTRCGTIRCETLTYWDGDRNRWYTDMFTIDPSSVGGDSGAPGYRPEANSKASVTGIQSARISGPSCVNGADAEFSKWHHIRDYFGLTLVTW